MVTTIRTGEQRPRLSLWPSGAVSSAVDEAVFLAESCGLYLDDWQRWCLEGMLAERVDGRWASKTSVLLLPRQNGKNAVLEALELAGLFLFGWKRMIHTAHHAKTAANHQRRMWDLIRGNPELEDVCAPYFANGKEAIVRKDTEQRLEFITRTARAGRGDSPQLVVYDEALHLTDEQINAITPSMSAQSMNPEGAPMQVYTSSAPLPTSDVLHRVRKSCIDGSAKSTFFAEWSCEAGADPNDRENWYAANPGLGIRISEEWVEETELLQMSPEGFAVERMGVVLGWDVAFSELPEWAHCSDPDSVMTGKPSIAVDVSPDLASWSIGVAGPAKAGNLHVELVEQCATSSKVVEILTAMHKAHRVPIMLDPRAAAAGIIPDLLAAKVPVVEVSTTDLVKACAHLKQLVRDGQVRHRQQQPLDTAVAGAAVRTIGEGWAWTRRVSTVDISPLVAVTLAAWAARSERPNADGWLMWDD
jgi:phage terminase large subunit-like protein